MKNVLIIGGEGYIGSYLFTYLSSVGIRITSYGNKETDYNLLNQEYINEFEYIILLAGHSSVLSCAGELRCSWNNNVRNFSNLVNKLNKKQKLIYASSSSVYGNALGKCYKEEEHSLEFVNNYDLTKISLDMVASSFIANKYNIMALRFGTVNGGSPVIRKDLMINSMVYSSLYNGVITINNKNISRPLLSIVDLGRAVERIITEEFYPGIYNLASFNSSVDKISEIVKYYTNSIIIDNGDYSGMYDYTVDTQKFKNFYNFEFKSSIEDITLDVIDCYTNKTPKVVSRDLFFKYGG